MNEGKKNTGKLLWQDFLNYLTRQFTHHEMHHFERKVDKSAFDTEALEGLEQFAGASMDNDIELLKDHINKRNTLFDPKPQKRFPIKSLAAVAVVVIVSGIVISLLLNRQDKPQQLAEHIPFIADSLTTETEPTAEQGTPRSHTPNNSENAVAANPPRQTPATSQTTATRKMEPASTTVTERTTKKTENDLLLADEEPASEEWVAVALANDNAETDAAEEVNQLQIMHAEKSIEPDETATNLTMKHKIRPSALGVEETSTTATQTGKDFEATAPAFTPLQGDSLLRVQLKAWLKEQKLTPRGTVELKIGFEGNTNPARVTVVKGFDAEANKAIQFYIMNKTQWVNKNPEAFTESEFTYIFSL